MERVSPIIAAVICASDVGSIQRLLSEGQLNADSKSGCLLLACQFEQEEIVDVLLAADANPNARDTTSRRLTALHYAGAARNLRIMRALVAAGAQVKARDKDGEHPLFLARAGNEDVVKLLLSMGASPNDPNDRGDLPLMAASENGHLGAVGILIGAGTNVNQQSNGGYSAVFQASTHGHAEVVRELVSARADVNLRTKKGETAIMIASDRGHVSTVEVLIVGGADLNLKNDLGSSALGMASGRGFSEVVEVLLKHGADIDDTCAGGEYTPLIAACDRGHIATAQILIAGGADVNKKSLTNVTALGIAAAGGHARVVEALIAAGAAVNVRIVQNRTPLMAACMGKGSLEVVKLLLAAEADITLRDNHGKDALDYAIAYDHRETTFLLATKLYQGKAPHEIEATAAELGLDASALASQRKGGSGADEDVDVEQMREKFEKTWREWSKATKACKNCGKKESLKRCSACRKVSFCSVECQRAAWPTHKALCKKWQEELTKQEEEEQKKKQGDS